MKITLQKPDIIGAIASTLCIIHCAATPLLFLINTCSFGDCETVPSWWKNIDFLFLLISFTAIYQSTKKTTNFVKPLLWFNWSLLFSLIINEKLEMFTLPEIITYITAFTLTGLHLYSLKYCQCKNDKCCVKNG